jgi:hypothetical protein
VVHSSQSVLCLQCCARVLRALRGASSKHWPKKKSLIPKTVLSELVQGTSGTYSSCVTTNQKNRVHKGESSEETGGMHIDRATAGATTTSVTGRQVTRTRAEYTTGRGIDHRPRNTAQAGDYGRPFDSTKREKRFESSRARKQ